MGKRNAKYAPMHVVLAEMLKSNDNSTVTARTADGSFIHDPRMKKGNRHQRRMIESRLKQESK